MEDGKRRLVECLWVKKMSLFFLWVQKRPEVMPDYNKQESEAPFHQLTKVFRFLDSTYAKKYYKARCAEC